MTSPKDYLTDKEKLMDWVKEEVEPYFKGEFGTMDTMLEMFITQLDEKVSALLTSEVERAYDSGMSKGYIKGRTDLQPFFKEERERLLKEVDEKVIGDEDYAGKEFMGKFGVEMMGEDEAEHRNYLKKEQRKALSDVGGGK